MFLVSTLFDIIGTAIGEAKLDYKYLLAARIVQGFSTSAFESLLMAVVGDMYYVHERGLRIAIINFIINSASSLASIICGQVYQDIGYYWLFHLFQIFLVIQFVAMFLFCPETTYIRDSQYETDVTADEKLATTANVVTTTTNSSVPPKKTFVQELAVFTKTYSPDNLIKFLFGPFLTLLNPAGCYAVITAGLLNSWYVGSSIIISGIFSGPPWNFGAAQVGYIGAGPVIGGLVATMIAAWGSDPIIKWMGRRNHGI